MSKITKRRVEGRTYDLEDLKATWHEDIKLKDLITHLTDVYNSLPEEYREDATFALEHRYEYDSEYEITTWRVVPEDELKKEELDRAKRILYQERQEYLRLQEKFENE